MNNISTAVDPAKSTVNLPVPAEVGKPYVGVLLTSDCSLHWGLYDYFITLTASH